MAFRWMSEAIIQSLPTSKEIQSAMPPNLIQNHPPLLASLQLKQGRPHNLLSNLSHDGYMVSNALMNRSFAIGKTAKKCQSHGPRFGIIYSHQLQAAPQSCTLEHITDSQQGESVLKDQGLDGPGLVGPGLVNKRSLLLLSSSEIQVWASNPVGTEVRPWLIPGNLAFQLIYKCKLLQVLTSNHEKAIPSLQTHELLAHSQFSSTSESLSSSSTLYVLALSVSNGTWLLGCESIFV